MLRKQLYSTAARSCQVTALYVGAEEKLEAENIEVEEVGIHRGD